MRIIGAGSTTGRAAGLAMLVCGLLSCAAQAAGPIYSCVDANGKRLTSDRPIPECLSREQRVLNADGSTKQIVPPSRTADERAELEARERNEAAERTARLDAIKRDRNLLARFPNEAAHQKAREAALDDLRKAVRVSEDRVVRLAGERKPLMDEAEFYVGKALPAQLKRQLDANDAASDAQRTLIQNQQSELVRVNALYDAELERLRKLWGGVQPGSMGNLPVAAAAASAPRRAASR